MRSIKEITADIDRLNQRRMELFSEGFDLTRNLDEKKRGELEAKTQQLEAEATRLVQELMAHYHQPESV